MERELAIEILKKAGSTESEAIRHWNDGTIVYELDDARENFKEYFCEDDFEYEEFKEYYDGLKAFIDKGDFGRYEGDMLIELYQSKKYLIRYCL